MFAAFFKLVFFWFYSKYGHAIFFCCFHQVQLQSKLALNLAKELNRHVSTFVRDCFHVTDRGAACILMERYVGVLSATSPITADLKVRKRTT